MHRTIRTIASAYAALTRPTDYGLCVSVVKYYLVKFYLMKLVGELDCQK